MVRDSVDECGGGFLGLSEEQPTEATDLDPDFPGISSRMMDKRKVARFKAQVKKAAKIAEWKFNPAMPAVCMHYSEYLTRASGCHRAYASEVATGHMLLMLLCQ